MQNSVMPRTGLGLSNTLLPPNSLPKKPYNALSLRREEVKNYLQISNSPKDSSKQGLAEISEIVDGLPLEYFIARNANRKKRSLLAEVSARTCDTQTSEGYKILPFGSIGLSSRGPIILNLNTGSQVKAYIFNNRGLSPSDSANFKDYSFSNNVHSFTYSHEGQDYNFKISHVPNKSFQIEGSQGYQCNEPFQIISSRPSSTPKATPAPDAKYSSSSLEIASSGSEDPKETTSALELKTDELKGSTTSALITSSFNSILSGSGVSSSGDCISIKLKDSQEYRFSCSDIFSFFPAKLNEYLEKNLPNASFGGFLKSTAEYLRISNGNCSFSSQYQGEGAKEDLIKFNQSLIKLAKNSNNEYCKAFNEQIELLNHDQDKFDKKNEQVLAIALPISIGVAFLLLAFAYRYSSDKKEKENNRIRQQKDIKLRAERLDNRTESVEVAV